MTETGAPGPTLLDALRASPTEFDFDAAVAILLRARGLADPAEAIRFEAPTGLGFTPGDVLDVRPDEDGGDGGDADDGRAWRLVPGMIGLTGPAGALPRVYTEHVIAQRRERSRALADFLDLLAQRPIGQFASAALKYRPHRMAEIAALGGAREDGLRATLRALTGHVIPGVAAALGDMLDVVLHHAGSFAAYPRSAERLAAILSDWLARPVSVEQYAGRWIRLDPSERSVLGSRFARLGLDAAAGTAWWDVQSAIRIRVGPLPRAEFEALLPGSPTLAALALLARAYLDGAVEFTVNPILAASDVPALALETGGGASSRLGLGTWLGTGIARTSDASEAEFRPPGHRLPPSRVA